MASPRQLPEEGTILGEIVAESWVEVADQPASPAPSDRVFVPHGPEDYLRLLREAQRDSNQSSALVSLASTRKNSPHSSPKSPPNSPNNEPAGEGEELKGFYINYCSKVSKTKFSTRERILHKGKRREYICILFSS